MKILVTGGSGFIGKAVLKALQQHGFEIYATYNRQAPTATGIQWLPCDLLDPVAVRELFKGVSPTHLIQLAWCTGQGSYWTDEANLKWITANLEIAKQFVANGGRRCFFAGTSAEYQWGTDLLLDEYSTSLNPLLLYGGSKLSVYWALTRYFEKHQVPFIWGRFFNPFGEGEDRQRLIPKTCLRLLSGESLSFDSATSMRDFMHVDDVGAAIASSLLGAITGPVNVASGEPVSVREVIEKIALIYGYPERVTFAIDNPNNVAEKKDIVVANTRRLAGEAKWRPSVTFHERMVQTCKWWEHQYKNQNTI